MYGGILCSLMRKKCFYKSELRHKVICPTSHKLNSDFLNPTLHCLTQKGNSVYFNFLQLLLNKKSTSFLMQYTVYLHFSKAWSVNLQNWSHSLGRQIKIVSTLPVALEIWCGCTCNLTGAVKQWIKEGKLTI